jgi:hypothetical protein
MEEESSDGARPERAEPIEVLRIELPVRLVDAAREALSARSAPGAPGSLDALIGEALRRHLQPAVGTVADAERSLGPDEGDHTPDGWYD